MINDILGKIKNSLNKFNEINDEWSQISSFDINIFNITYCFDPILKKRIIKEQSSLKENSNKCENFISVCLQTPHDRKRIAMKEFVSFLESELCYKITYLRTCDDSQHFYVYFEYNGEYQYPTKIKKALLPKI